MQKDDPYSPDHKQKVDGFNHLLVHRIVSDFLEHNPGVIFDSMPDNPHKQRLIIVSDKFDFSFKKETEKTIDHLKVLEQK